MSTGLVFAALLACLPPKAEPAVQAEARQEQPQEQPREKPPARGWLHWPPEDAADRDEPERGFFPLIGNVVPGSGMSLGGGYRDYALFGSPVGFEVAGLASRFAYQAYHVHFGFLRAHRHALDLRPGEAPVSFVVDDRRRARRGIAAYLDARYRYLPRSRFYGIGPDSEKEDRTDYLVKGGAIDLAFQDQVTPAFGIAARVGVLNSQIAEGHDDEYPDTTEGFTEAEAPGIAHPPRYLVAGLAVAFDGRERNRDRAALDLEERRAAVFASAAAWRFEDTGGPQYDFTRLVLELRGYVAAPSPRAVIALRTLLWSDLTREGGDVPFFMQGTLGGSHQLRAFGSWRWQDRALAHASVEYRVRVHRLVEVAPFFDAGMVAPALGHLDGRHLKADGGIGFRAHWRDYALGRMDWAWGSEGWRVVFDVGPAF